MTSLAIRIAILECLANEKRPWFCQGARLGGWDIIHVIREKSLFDVVRRILSLRQRLECARLSAEYPRHVVRHDWNATRKDVDVLTRRALLEP